MTAPVVASADSGSEQATTSEKVQVTSPMIAENIAGRWKVRFHMPSNYTAGSLPEANDPRIKFLTLPGEQQELISAAKGILLSATRPGLATSRPRSAEESSRRDKIAPRYGFCLTPLSSCNFDQTRTCRYRCGSGAPSVV